MWVPVKLLLVLPLVSAQWHSGGSVLDHESTMVHLFEWKWSDVAAECERFLAPHGYGAVQISPPSENLEITIGKGSRPWWERYQPVSYILKTRSGDEKAFMDMTTRCNRVGITVVADVVINHMSAKAKGTGKGTAGTTLDLAKKEYPAVPYSMENFHGDCGIQNYNDAYQVRNCALVSLNDLDQSQKHVRNKVVGYMNHLLELGVGGFRMDAAKHMNPDDLKQIYGSLNDLSTEYGFPPNTKPYIFQEVIYFGNEAIKPQEYLPLANVTEFKYGMELSKAFEGGNPLKWLVNWGEPWSLIAGNKALVFIDNHDTQRGHAGEGLHILTHKNSNPYKAAIGFMLSHPYGRPRVMSSYEFISNDQGPPSDSQHSILSPIIKDDGTCGNGWVCEHRWRQIYQMVEFRNVVKGTKVEHWWDNGNNQIAFSRGNKGFVLFNIERANVQVVLQTGLPAGRYCDVVSGWRQGNSCTGRQYTVMADGTATIAHKDEWEDDFLAIHVGKQSRINGVTANTKNK